MKLERISENQIRCTLNGQDLSERSLSIPDLAYGSTKARELFEELMEQAHTELHFDGEEAPLMIEAIPMSDDGIMLLITKVDDPEELDTRFSRFTEGHGDTPAAAAQTPAPSADEVLELFRQLSEALSPLAKAADDSGKEAPSPAVYLPQVFEFKDLDELSGLAGLLPEGLALYSALYKHPDRGTYLLVLRLGDGTVEQLNSICNRLAEYGTRLQVNAAAEAHYKEHFKVLIPQNALGVLAKL